MARAMRIPAAGELVDLAQPVFFLEAETGEHRADLRVQSIAVEGVESLLKHGVALGCGFVFGTLVVQNG